MKRSKIWKVAPFKSWVSKSDIVEFLRCEYRVFIAQKTSMKPIDFVNSDFIKTLMARGSTFEENVIGTLPLEEVESIDKVIDKDVLFRSTDVLENHELGLRGVADLIRTGEGKLYPIEIKSHRDVAESDRLELAFYWRLLQPSRRGTFKPKGYVLVNTGELVEVALTQEDFKRLEEIINRIRIIKEIGTEPIICGECKLCRLKDECLSEVYNKGGLSLIHGIAHVRQRQLLELGIKDVQALADTDAKSLRHEWRELSQFAPGPLEIQKMVFHAKCWIELRPTYFGKQPIPIGNEFIIMDLEYDPMSHIWLVGLMLVHSEDTKCYQFFADNVNQEKIILTSMLDVLNRYDDLPILTWYGLGADLPKLAAAWGKHALPLRSFHQLVEKHLDLYQVTLDNYRFPLKSFSLKDIGKHLGFVRKHQDIDGRVALDMYDQYLALSKKNKGECLAIKNELLEYNREDLQATLYVLRQLKKLAGLQD